MNEIRRIKQNIRKYFTASGAGGNYYKKAVSALDADVRKHHALLRPEGSFSDLDYSELPKMEPWSLFIHYRRIFEMAVSCSTKGSKYFRAPAISALINRSIKYSLKYVYADCAQPGNWWYWEIGLTMWLGPALILMEGRIENTVMQSSLAAIKYLIKPEPVGVGQNLVWSSISHLYYSVLAKDVKRLSLIQRKVGSTCVIAGNNGNPRDAAAKKWCKDKGLKLKGSTKEGIRPDYSYHMHLELLYTGGYGAGFLQDVSKYIYFVNGTRYTVSREAFKVLVNYAREGTMWCIYNKYYDPSVMGREIYRQEINAAAGLTGLLALSGIKSPFQKEFAGFAKKMLSTWEFGVSLEMSGLMNSQSGKKIKEFEHAGHKYYPYSDYTIHRKNGRYVSLKMLSKRVRASEICMNEGRFSWHLSDGFTYIVRKGNEYLGSNVLPVLDWQRLPGTTVERKKRPWFSGLAYGIKDFTGGCSTGSSGVSAMDFEAVDGGITAKKSWFFFEDEMVCLGSNINCPGKNTAETIINQQPLKNINTPVIISKQASALNSVYCDGIGYLILDKQKITVQKETRKGSWLALGRGTDKIYKKPVLTLLYDHGRNVKDGSYAYAVVLGKKKEELAKYRGPGILKVLANNARVHAVLNTRQNAAGMVFWEKGRFGNLEADKPCLIYSGQKGRMLELAFCDPKHEKGVLNLAYRGRLKAVSLPKGVSIKVKNYLTTISCKTENGRNIFCKFRIL